MEAVRSRCRLDVPAGEVSAFRWVTIDVSATAVSSLSRLRGRVGVGVPPQNALFEWIDRFPTRRALARNCAAERVDLPRKRER